MTTIYRIRDDVRYAEIACASCHTKAVVSESALEFYAMAAPFLAYLCPACRRQRYPDAVLYGEISQEEQEQRR